MRVEQGTIIHIEYESVGTNINQYITVTTGYEEHELVLSFPTNTFPQDGFLCDGDNVAVLFDGDEFVTLRRE